MNNYGISFIPRKVVIYKCSNYKGDLPVTIQFDKFTTIVGETGAGKSSIIDAITFPIWKTTPRLKGSSIKIEDFCQTGGFCEIEFEKNGNLYTIRRGRKTSGNSFVVLTINGERYPETSPTKVDQKIKEIIGIDYESFANTGYIPQDEVKDIINKTNSERLNLLKKIFKLDVFDKALTITKERLKTVEKEIANLDGRISEKKIFVKNNSNIELLIQNEKRKLPPLIKKIKELKSRLNEKRVEILKYQEEKDMFVKLQSSFSSLENQLNSLNNDISSTESEYKQLTKNAEKLESDLSKYDEDELRKKYDALKKIQNLSATLKNYQLQYSKIEKSYKERKNKIQLHYRNYDVTGMEILKKYREDPSIDPNYVYDIIKSEVIRSIYDEIDNEFKENTKTIVENIETTKNEISMLQEYVDNMTIFSVSKSIDYVTHKKSQIIEIKTRIKYLKSSLEEKKKKKDALESSLKELSEKLDSYRSSYEIYDCIRNEIESIHSKITKTEGNKKMIMGIIKEMRKRSKDVEIAKNEIIQMENTLKKMHHHKSALEFIKNNVFHRKGMTVYTLRAILSDIEFKASEIVTALTYHRIPSFKKDGTPNRMQKISLIPKKTGLEIEVDDVNARRFSGGEKTIISMAIRLALSQQLLEMSSLQSSFRVLIIDEGDLRSLDNKTISVFIDLLRSYRNIFDVIILITHIEEIMNDFDYVIHVKKNPVTGYSMIET